MYTIPFNKPYVTGDELRFIEESIKNKKFSGDGPFTKKCEELIEMKYGFRKTFLTTSCTDALELASIASEIQPGDEVIMPSYTFVSTANPFVLRGAKIIFADSLSANPNLNVDLIEALITPKTKAIVPVHYGGVACDMDGILDIANRHNLIVIEDAAQGIDAYYKGRALGSIGHFGAISFHETKNIIAGEGGLIVVNNKADILKTEVAREKGTNRSSFFRGEVDKYNWVGMGSSFLPSDLIAAFLLGQLFHIAAIQSKRIALWKQYQAELKMLEEGGQLALPVIPDFASNNGHIFYIICKDLKERDKLTLHLKLNGIQASFHYQALHDSPFYKNQHDGRRLPNADRFSDCLLRLPLFFDLEPAQVSFISEKIREFYQKH
jgi:dTDP-4-amino-4,6-dideoxygalactose transaminase